MTALAEPRLTVAEYLAFERASEIRHEFYAGEIFAMSGASAAHNSICWNLGGTLYPQLKGSGCRGFVTDMRVAIDSTSHFTYPDLVVVCGEPRFLDASQPDSLLNPSLVVEVLSASTEDYDRGRKFVHYRTLPSLQGYLLIAQDRVHAELFLRQPGERWLFSESSDPDARIELPVAGASFRLGDLYEGIALGPVLRHV
jgi:Uma2 family endonuclease